MSVPRHDYWVRCSDCDLLYFVEYAPTKLQTNQYATRGCQMCRYQWLRKTTIDTMYRLLRKGFVMVKNRQIDDWWELAPVIISIYRNNDPIFVRNCFKEASVKFQLHFNRIWERNLQ